MFYIYVAKSHVNIIIILTVYRQRNDKFLRPCNVAGYASVVPAVGGRHLVYD